MPNNNRGRGGFRAPANGRGRGRGRGRGGRGRGRGVGGRDSADQLDGVVQMWSDSPNGSPRSRGRGGSFSNLSSGRATPTRGSSSPRGRGGRNVDYNHSGSRGRGNRGSKLRPDAPLSNLLYAERPLLRPVIFVPSVHTRTLFQEEEEILQAAVEEPEDNLESHVPTADRVARVFSRNIEQMELPASDDSDELEEVDFADMARIRNEVDMAAPIPATSSQVAPVEEVKFTGFFVDSGQTRMLTHQTDVSIAVGHEGPTQRGGISDELSRHFNPTSVPSQANIEMPLVIEEDDPIKTVEQHEPTGFFIDTNPTPAALLSRGTTHDIIIDRMKDVLPFGHEISAEPDEIIVYVAPHPRSGRVAPATSETIPLVPSFPSTSVVACTTPSFASVQESPERSEPQQPQQSAFTTPAPAFDSISFTFANSPSPKKQPRHPPVFTSGSLSKAKLKVRQKEARASRKRVGRQALFGSFGAIMQEAQLRERGNDPRWEQRRRDDSDVDWGDQNSVGEGQDGADELSNGMGAMDLDPDLNLDVEALKRFAKGMGTDGERFVTMDDIADKERMRLEDEEDEERGSSGGEEGDDLMTQEEKQMLAEPLDEDDEEDEVSSDESDSSSDDGVSPRAGFQARLERLRQQSRGKRYDHAMSGDSSDDEIPLWDYPSWADLDEEFMAHIEDALMEDNDSLHGRTGKEKTRLFRAIHNGNAADMADMSPAYNTQKGKNKDVPPNLLEQWDKDRAKKAENKRARQQARLELAADPFSIKKGGKKGHKAMLAAARLESSGNHTVDMTTLVQQIRQFLANLGGSSSMALPPMEKCDRARVHELATAFHLKSLSKGSGQRRYTTLIKTTRSGVEVNERKIGTIIAGQSRGVGPLRVRADKGKGKIVVPRHKDGDEVGKAAPKIGHSNIGFKMLSLMGWSEGERIGASADGLHVPLTAVIKNTKLGLGANR